MTTVVPSAPQSITVTPGTNKVTLEWTSPANNGGASILSYRINRSSNGIIYSQIGNVEAGTLSYLDNSIESGTNYSYYVVAVNSSGERAIPPVNSPRRGAETLSLQPVTGTTAPFSEDF
jgi:fibronectin type 3 domain-containing protein